MLHRSSLAALGAVLVLTLAFAPASHGEETLTLIERICALGGAGQDGVAYFHCLEETARQMMISTAPRQPYMFEIISGDPLDTLSDQLADAS